MFKKARLAIDNTDSSLVMHSLGGNQDAFCQIVTRYQNLLCSLAYSSIGDIKYSEDIAQETFVEAWKKLDTLHDPEKLKAWLCGILRFKISRYRRKEAKQPIQGADELEQHEHIESENTALEQATMQQQQNSLLWKVLDEIEPSYREPLILFYREQQSIEKVAQELDLTSDTVKQRLSRGRKLLKSAMSALVEEGLANSKPGALFTAVVMSTISSISPPAKAALFGSSAAKTGSLFNLATILTVLASCSGLISSFFGLRAGLDQSRTQRERKLVIKSVTLFIMFAALLVIGLLGLKYLSLANANNVIVYTVLSQIVVASFIGSYFLLVSKMLLAMRKLRAHERIFQPQAFADKAAQPNAKQREFKSRLTLFGVPLIHMQFGMPEQSDQAAFGWIAGGSYARGLLFAWGGVAIAPISVGIISFGIFTVGAVGFGLLSTGTVAIGIVAFGAAAIGYKAFSSLSSLGWESAYSNGFAIANDAAIAPTAFANQINNEQAADIIRLPLLANNYHWLLAIIVILVIVPSVWHSNKVRQRMR